MPVLRPSKFFLSLALAACFSLTPYGGYASGSSKVPEYDPLVFGPKIPSKIKLVKGHKGMVVTAQHLASQVGADILRKGGNAADAAVAVGYALAVVYPAAGSLGGGGFATLYDPNAPKGKEKAFFVDYRERAPLKATQKMFLDKNGRPSPKESRVGWKAVATPGMVAGLEEIRKKYGTKSREELILPAIRLADKGFILERGDIDLLNTSLPFFKAEKEAQDIFLRPDGTPLQKGDRLVQKHLATTLRAVVAQGEDGFYKGKIAREIARSSQEAGGLLSEADLKAYKVRELAPLQCQYRGYKIYTAPLPSAGGVALCEMLGILEYYDLKKAGLHTEKALQIEIEAMRRAYWDRRLLGDGVSSKIIDHLLDKAYQKEIAQTLPKEAPENPQTLPEGDGKEKQETTHYSIIDKNGMSVSVTCTLDGWFGAGVMGGKTGIWMNDEMDDFSLKPGALNMFGIPGAKANEIAPQKTPLSSMSPTIVTQQDGNPVLITGSPGGSRIPTIVLSTLTGVVDYKLNVAQAVQLPRIHEQWAPSVVEIEPKALSPRVQKKLEKKNYHFVQRHPWGMADSIAVKEKGTKKEIFGAADNRRYGGLAVKE